jgi:hypothetical protein
MSFLYIPLWGRLERPCLAYFLYFKQIEEAYEITLLSVCRCISPVFVRQKLDKDVPAATSAYVTIEELLDAVFSM